MTILLKQSDHIVDEVTEAMPVVNEKAIALLDKDIAAKEIAETPAKPPVDLNLDINNVPFEAKTMICQKITKGKNAGRS